MSEDSDSARGGCQFASHADDAEPDSLGADRIAFPPAFHPIPVDSLPSQGGESRHVIRRLPPVSNRAPTAGVAPAKSAVAVVESLPVLPRDEAASAPSRSTREPEASGPDLSDYVGAKPMSLETDLEARLTRVASISIAELARLKVPPAITSQAESYIRKAVSLADRGALFAARNEFLLALRLIAQSLDAELGRPIHSPSLLVGLRALEEADDFAMTTKSVESDVNLEGIILGHTTSVLKNVDPSQLTPLVAIQRYYEHAYQHLALAANRERIASEALYGLGRLEILKERTIPESERGAPRAVAYLNAALTVNPANGRAANELGVVLARRGRLDEARQVLEHGIKTEPNPLAMANLARVYQHLGQPRAAQAIEHQLGGTSEAVLVGSTEGLGNITWVDPQTFSRMASEEGLPPLEPIAMTLPTSAMASSSASSQSSPAPTRQPAMPSPSSHVPRTASRPTNAGAWFGF